LVPDAALGMDQGGSYLLVLGADHAVAQKHVTAGPLEGTLRVTETGLDPDDLVVGRWLAARDPGPDGPARDHHPDGCGAMIAKFFIERPVLANVLAILFVLIGGVSLFSLPITQLPDVVPPTVQVTTPPQNNSTSKRLQRQSVVVWSVPPATWDGTTQGHLLPLRCGPARWLTS
jgi:hypothetical protein